MVCPVHMQLRVMPCICRNRERIEFVRGALTSATPFAAPMLPHDRRHRASYRSMCLMFYVDVVHTLLSPF
ncbi:hypothetical protein BDA96_04G140800 [Sorghum bicolor]|uniref:Uncharacterized protein n=2 Tax=Sorghum bicolor TaxID=4558 RepID=A0A921R626_SORBI|nr:hypothetical protein BDA96_04G140800 [Sorghum bicolor]KXG30078.1 hypothetical protein SORBI_3004G132000 [Sorghum bicolor]